jgi:hypothetical protein
MLFPSDQRGSPNSPTRCKGSPTYSKRAANPCGNERFRWKNPAKIWAEHREQRGPKRQWPNQEMMRSRRRGRGRSGTSACVFVALRRSNWGALARRRRFPGGARKRAASWAPPPNHAATRVRATVAALSLRGACGRPTPPGRRPGGGAEPSRPVTTCGDRTAWSTCQGACCRCGGGPGAPWW